MNWNDSQSYCELTYGTSLATIKSSRDNQLAMIAAVYSVSSLLYAWIGMSNIDDTTTFKWIDGTRNDFYNYTNWGSGEPNNFAAIEDCGQLKYDGTWNDHQCAYKFPFVCNVYPRTTSGLCTFVC